MVSERPWADEHLRKTVLELLDQIEAGQVQAAAMDMWRTAFADVQRWMFADGLWNIWGGITDEYTHPNGDSAEGDRLAIESAAHLRDALGDEASERGYCDIWVERICG